MNNAPANVASGVKMQYVPLEMLHAHPENDYPSSEAELADLVDSIRREGLAQLPLVREFEGEYQILAGHRRVESYRRLREENPDAYATMPVSILEDCDDDRALVLLEVTNLLTRQVTPAERARHFERLWNIVPQMRKKAPELKGVRTSQVIADLITRETGQSISRASVDRVLAAGKRAQEVAHLVAANEGSIIAPWITEFSTRDGFSPAVVKEIAAREGSVQKRLWADYQRENMTPRQLEKLLVRKKAKTDADIERALDSVIRTLRDVSAWHTEDGAAIDMYRVGYIRRQLDRLTGAKPVD